VLWDFENINFGNCGLPVEEDQAADYLANLEAWIECVPAPACLPRTPAWGLALKALCHPHPAPSQGTRAAPGRHAAGHAGKGAPYPAPLTAALLRSRARPRNMATPHVQKMFYMQRHSRPLLANVKGVLSSFGWQQVTTDDDKESQDADSLVLRRPPLACCTAQAACAAPHRLGSGCALLQRS